MIMGLLSDSIDFFSIIQTISQFSVNFYITFLWKYHL